MDDISSSLNLHFTPLLLDVWLAVIIGAALMLLLLSFLQRREFPFLRSLCVAVLITFLFGPSLIKEQREAVKDVAVVIVDRSPSQDMGKRHETTDKALAYLQEQAAKIDDLELRVIEAPTPGTLTNETKLFEALDRAFSDVPRQRRAGAILLSDGQIHDVPQNGDMAERYGPVHLLLTGKKNEKDRQIVIIQAAAYGIVGQDVSVTFKVEDSNTGEDTATITLDTYNEKPEVFSVPVGEEQTITLPLAHAGQNVFELRVDEVPDELTNVNNRAALIVNGVRDRLRVLLISGQPYSGARTWRDLLTSDPAVDLVHFTILREPDKVDATPQNELSLIAFPFEELFEIKLYEFDLIIFDRYRLNRILPQNYFTNIVRYVEKGGALLVTSGVSDTSDDSIYFTSLMDVLPGSPQGEMVKKPYKPGLTDVGNKHPVTRNLAWPTGRDGLPSWGHWLRQVSLKVQSGEALMKGADDKPLVILDRVKEGRVAQIASDHIWLWARGFEGGGPHAELLRRIVHWLMKEPELDERALDVKILDDVITISSRDYRAQEMLVNMTKPDGSHETVTLKSEDGTLQAHIKATQLGVYAFEDKNGQRQFAVVGAVNPPELQGVRTTPDIVKPLSEASGGGIIWLDETAKPGLRRLQNGQRFAGHDWIGLRRNGDYMVRGVENTPLLPAWLAALLIVGLVAFTWWREGRA